MRTEGLGLVIASLLDILRSASITYITNILTSHFEVGDQRQPVLDDI
jgi:hypothetical protein